LKKSTRWIVLIYGLLILGLGVLGYYQSHSKASLLSGLGSGSLLILCSFFQKKGLYMSLILTTLLAAIFCYRYAATQGHIPAFLATISGGMLIYLLVQTASWRK
jgi:uncharacterized membrane protein (UPF0136 family)